MLSHKIKRAEIRTDPTQRTNPQEIDTCGEPQRLSSVIERGMFGYKKILDRREQYNLWLCWLPKALTPRSRPTAAPEMLTPIPRKKSVRKVVSVKQEIKEEPQEPFIPFLPSTPLTPTPIVTTLPKRPRSASSGISTLSAGPQSNPGAYQAGQPHHTYPKAKGTG
jgi:hypothetical protein